MRCFYRKERLAKIVTKTDRYKNIISKEIQSTENFASCIGKECPFYYDFSDGITVEFCCAKAQRDMKGEKK